MSVIPMDPGVRSALRKLAPAFAHYEEVTVLDKRLDETLPSTVCVKERIVIKRGNRVATEAEAIMYVAEHTSVPLPKLYGTHTDESGVYMVVEFIPGDPLWHTWAKLSEVERDSLAIDLKIYVDQLRDLSGNYIGGIGNTPFFCDLLLNKSDQGPFGSQYEFHDFLAGLYRQEKPLSHFGSLLRKLMRDDHRIVFSHGDLNPGNIIIREGQIVGIIDWEMAGFFPEYWEYARACLGLRWNNSVLPDYISFVQKCMKPYPKQAWVVRIIDATWMRIN